MTVEEIEALATQLGDRNRAVTARYLSQDDREARAPGLYSWWTDDLGRSVLGATLGVEIPALVYAGQAGATKQPSGKVSNATLGSRIVDNHLKGNVGSSTFRQTVATLVARELSLEVTPHGTLTKDGNAKLSGGSPCICLLASLGFLTAIDLVQSSAMLSASSTHRSPSTTSR